MESPAKMTKLLEDGQLEAPTTTTFTDDGIPEVIWDDLYKNDRMIYFSLMCPSCGRTTRA
jgi:hypothetical protein